VFARAFLDELEGNQGIPLGAGAVQPHPQACRGRGVEEQVRADARSSSPSRAAGHEVGDFFFVPRAKDRLITGLEWQA
jgi:hypothetical protein